jgi:hypothetical protein
MSFSVCIRRLYKICHFGSGLSVETFRTLCYIILILRNMDRFVPRHMRNPWKFSGEARLHLGRSSFLLCCRGPLKLARALQLHRSSFLVKTYCSLTLREPVRFRLLFEHNDPHAGKAPEARGIQEFTAHRRTKCSTAKEEVL